MINLKTDQIKTFFEDPLKRDYTIAVAGIVFCVLFVSFLIIPKVNELVRGSRSARDMRDNISLVTTRAARMEEMTEKLEALKAENEGYLKQIPVEKEIPRLLEGLARTALNSGVDIRSITPHDIVASQVKDPREIYYKRQPVLLTAKAGYHQLGSFISALAEANRFITIEDLRIQYDPNYPRAHNIRIMMNTYISSQDESKKTK